ncbi:hypothetical protein [uncultured Maribacter sp.]|uniref:hypothetical protein n=1 Tax=uncultured Maribacter sp. TaxID=431308 RepID=UPI00262DC8FA|nr:hypothetical protein [uncultured Maribacter sp.]
MEKKNRKPYLILLAIIIFLLLIYFIDEKEKKELEVNKIYTIGILTESYAIVGDFNFRYTYKYNNKTYNGLNNSNKKWKNEIGKKFLLKLSYKNPSSSILMLNFPICDTTVVAPKLGWKKIPNHLICLDND